MAALAATYGFHFNQPWLLLAGLLIVPVIWLGRRHLAPLGQMRRTLAITLRVLVVALLALLLGRPTISREHKQITVIAVMDRSKSVPEELRAGSMGYLETALADKPAGDRVALVNVAEAALIATLPSESTELPRREISLTGMQSRLADGVQLSLAIAPPATATRILLISDGNETAGDLVEAARVAAANGIPIDVLPLRYEYRNEVIFKRLVAPPTARINDTVPLRFVLSSTGDVSGKLVLSEKSRSIGVVPIKLKRGTNVHAVSVPIGAAGTYRFEGRFIADDERADTLTENNRASAITHVAGPGHVMVIDSDGKSAAELVKALSASGIDARYRLADTFPTSLGDLLSADAVVMVNTDNSFTYAQQELMCRYVNDLGRGLIMVGGPNAFGAGGWIGSPVQDILPVDLDPPQKKEMPKGALVMIMHACEFARGNYWGKRVAIAAAKSLSSQDLVGVLDYSWQGGAANWVYPLQKAGDKKAVVKAINKMQMGDMPDFGPPMRAAYAKLKAATAGQKHIIIISDGDPQPPPLPLIKQMRAAGITCSTVCVFPHGGTVPPGFIAIARATGGRFYNPKDPKKLPQIFVKEAQVVRRSLIVEREFTPSVSDAANEVVRGFVGGGVPRLNGYVLTGQRGGVARTVLKADDDPLLAVRQSGLGRTAAFTSSADTRWASQWIAWGGYRRFWKQLVDWTGKSRGQGDCEIYADVQGREVTLTVEAVDAQGKFVQFAALQGQVIGPEMKGSLLNLTQVGPGRYRARFQADSAGSYLVNLRYRKVGAGGRRDEAATGDSGVVQTVVTVPYAPEFRDLSDNAALLRRVAEESGGRVLPADVTKAKVFDRGSLVMPRTYLPLTVPLLIAWVTLFLLDVAVRRIAVDFRAIGSRIAQLPAMIKPKRQAGETLEQLKSTRERLREQMAAGRKKRRAEPLAGKRYQAPGADAAGEAAPPPIADVQKPRQDAPPPAGPAKETEPSETPAGPEHLQRLLRAKRKARGGDGKKA